MIRVMHDCQIANMERNMAQYARDKSSENGEDISHLSEELKSKYENLMSNRSEFHELYGKIFLLFKSSDSESRELFKYLDCFREKVGDSTSYSVNYSFMDNVISELQNILKEEWEVTKARSWVKL